MLIRRICCRTGDWTSLLADSTLHSSGVIPFVTPVDGSLASVNASASVTPGSMDGAYLIDLTRTKVGTLSGCLPFSPENPFGPVIPAMLTIR